MLGISIWGVSGCLVVNWDMIWLDDYVSVVGIFQIL